MKKHIPNSITLLNLLCGTLASFFAIIFLKEINNLAWIIIGLIFLGAFFDFIDGFIARLLKVSSELGKQLDSLADLISFSVAPVFFLVAVELFLNGAFSYYVLPLFIIPMFAGLRLGKFNLLKDTATPYFIGLPTPATAIFIIFYALMILNTKSNILNSFTANIIFAATISYLMNSQFKLFSLKFAKWNSNIKKGIIIFGLLSIATVIIAGWYSPIIILIIYFITSYFTFKSLKK